MLRTLSIKNIVLIEACDVEFARGLNVLSGETGAGKSILLDALGLVLGARADAALVRRGAENGSVVAEFDVSGSETISTLLEELDLEAADTLLVRRSLGVDGKSQARVNDMPVTVSALKRLGEALVEISGQHEARGLLDTATHRELLDGFGNHGKALAVVREAYEAWKGAQEKLQHLQATLAAARREEDYLKHISAELASLAPKPGEEQELADARSVMMQSEKLFELLNEATQEMNAGKGVAAQLRGVQRMLSRSSLTSGARFQAVLEALDTAAERADEATQALEKIGEEATYSPEKLEALEERLFALRAAARKHGITVDELAALLEQTNTKLQLLVTQDAEEAALQKTLQNARANYDEAAAKLTKLRAASGVKLAKAVEAELEPLKMGGAKFRVALVPGAGEPSPGGAEQVEFEAATNVAKGSTPHFAPIAKIASGGELSRFLLAMKVALSGVRSVPTLIFDEIDTGTGGAVADAIGARLSKLGSEAQVLVVTHLPQVAARGDRHLLVEKAKEKSSIKTGVRALSAKEREEELARMLAGAEITTEARKAAKKLLEAAA